MVQKSKNENWVTAADVAAECGIGLSQAYRVLRKMNDELEQMGKITFSGRVPRKYFRERCF